MISHLSLVTLFCLILAVTSCGPATEQARPASAATTEADVAAINRVQDEHVNALNASDAAAYAALLTGDAVFLFPNRPAVIGREAIKADRQAAFDQNMMNITRSSEEVVVAGDWSFVRYTYTGMATSKADGEPTHINGKGISILQRQPDGSWKIARSILNGNFPPPGTGQ